MDVSPDKQNVDRVFANTKYVIDFYQRDYRWKDEQVNRLLDDIFHRFNDHYANLKDLDPTKEIVSSKYPWYYLNTYVTNTINGSVYIVDGQQRLTTLSLMLTKLLHQAKSYNSKLEQWIDGKIAGHTGYTNEFWIEHESHTHVQQALYEGKCNDELVGEGITGVNLIRNYQIISQRLDLELSDVHVFDTFVFFFLHRLVMIELDVEQTDVPMLFEAINDRGMRLRPHEILKGKLLGQIAKIELINERYNELWEKQAAAINEYEDDLLDDFFRSYLKGKHANTRNAGQQFDGDYHRQMFTGDMNKKTRFE